MAVSALFVKNRLMTSCDSQSFVKVPVTCGYTAAVLAFPGQRFKGSTEKFSCPSCRLHDQAIEISSLKESLASLQ